jgi:hypothetical protein
VLSFAIAAFGCERQREESNAPTQHADPVAVPEPRIEKPAPPPEEPSEPVDAPARGQLGADPFELVAAVAEPLERQRWKLRFMNYAGRCKGEMPAGAAEFVVEVARTTEPQRIEYEPSGPNVLLVHFGGLMGSVAVEARVELKSLGEPGGVMRAHVWITDRGTPLPNSLEGLVGIEVCP